MGVGEIFFSSHGSLLAEAGLAVVAHNGVLPLLGGLTLRSTRYALPHEVQECQPLLVHSQPPLLPGG